MRKTNDITPGCIVEKRRQRFYKNYLRQKQDVFFRLEREVIHQAERDGEKISCHKGCSFCCSVYIEATLKEGETIVYYLYQNEETLASFLRRYPGWRRETSQLGDKCTKVLRLARKPARSDSVQRDIADALLFYKLLNIACPFQIDGGCSIYPARPFTCAAHFVTTPPEWCNPIDPRQPNVYKASFADEISELYQARQIGPRITFMPVMVHEILKKDFICLSKIKDLPDFMNETMKDARIMALLRTYL